MDDVMVPKAVKRIIKTRLSDFEAPEVYTYSLESTIAEKFDAILKRMEATSRMKDFFDIYYLSSDLDFMRRIVTVYSDNQNSCQKEKVGCPLLYNVYNLNNKGKTIFKDNDPKRKFIRYDSEQEAIKVDKLPCVNCCQRNTNSRG